ncbi:hypothetical protein F5884DRAFT_523315 [Xylogone sp. PMI_703]|nr:hypothetical protein F5884DRAFT_523315 [Xylogone sp. PMI_703]
MSGYRPGHDAYINYAAAQPEHHPEEQRVYGSHHPELQHVGAQNLESLQDLGGGHHQQQVMLDPHGMSHHHPPPPPQYGSAGGQRLMGYTGAPLQQAAGAKRPRPHDELELGMDALTEGQMHGDMQSMGHPPPPQSMGGYGQAQTYHSHGLPNQGPRKMSRIGEPESSIMSQGAPSVVGAPGMPPPAPRPRGPKLKFTPEDDQLLVDLKENKNLTWKQIAEFFPGRSSGTLQVRYCTKLKAKTTQWTEETIQKLRTALHDYEQEKWRIIAQKVGTGFTSAACKEKAEEL